MVCSISGYDSTDRCAPALTFGSQGDVLSRSLQKRRNRAHSRARSQRNAVKAARNTVLAADLHDGSPPDPAQRLPELGSLPRRSDRRPCAARLAAVARDADKCDSWDAVSSGGTSRSAAAGKLPGSCEADGRRRRGERPLRLVRSRSTAPPSWSGPPALRWPRGAGTVLCTTDGGATHDQVASWRPLTAATRLRPAPWRSTAAPRGRGPRNSYEGASTSATRRPRRQPSYGHRRLDGLLRPLVAIDGAPSWFDGPLASAAYGTHAVA